MHRRQYEPTFKPVPPVNQFVTERSIDLDALVAKIAERVVARLQESGIGAPDPYLTTAEAALYMRAGKQRVFDLTSQGRLKVYKDGSRSLYRRDDIDAYLRGEG